MTTFSQVLFNAREQALSSDINRVEALVSRDAQDVILHLGLRDDYTAPSGSVVNGNQAAPVDRADYFGMPVGDAASFDILFLAGQAYMNLPSAHADVSNYSVVRWAGETISSIVPDGSQTRVDLIIATPAMVPTDLGSRNLIVDAVARTVAPANVFKTSDPLATISVVTGTPGNSDAPDCPAGSLALCEVITKASDTHSNTYRFVPRIWRRLDAFSTTHAILKGCKPYSSLHTEATSSAPLIFLGANGTENILNTAIIDGEVISLAWPGNGVSGGILYAQPDTNANPITATIDTNKDVFCYLYLCGGRHAPQNGVIVPSNNAYVPLQLVASLTPPYGTSGRAQEDLAINGVTVPQAATLYCGVWAIAVNTHNYKSCVIDGDWIYASTKASPLLVAGFTQPGGTGATGTATLTPPASSTVADLQINGSDTSQAVSLVVSATATPTGDYYVHAMRVSETYQTILGRCRCSLTSGSVFSWSGGAASTSVVIAATGYNMNVPRIAR